MELFTETSRWKMWWFRPGIGSCWQISLVSSPLFYPKIIPLNSLTFLTPLDPVLARHMDPKASWPVSSRHRQKPAPSGHSFLTWLDHLSRREVWLSFPLLVDYLYQSSWPQLVKLLLMEAHSDSRCPHDSPRFNKKTRSVLATFSIQEVCINVFIAT